MHNRPVRLGTLTAALVLTLTAPASAATGTPMDPRGGEGSTAFTGLAQAPDANLFTGSSGTGISLMLPPGRGSMTPALTLSYGSNGGRSFFGYGWDLPLARIERSTKFGVPNCGTEQFIMAGSTSWSVYFSTGQRFVSTAVVFPAPVAKIRRFNSEVTDWMLADFNGDGLPDLLYSDPTGSHSCQAGTRILDIYFNSGAGFHATATSLTVPNCRGVQRITKGTIKNTERDLVDVNGDGLPDWVRWDKADTWHVMLNVGGAFESQGASEPRTWSGFSGPIRQDSGDESYIDMLDFNGDGLLDWVRRENMTHARVRYNGHQATKPMLLTAMENGLGGRTSLRYAASTNCGGSACDHTGGDGKPDLPFVTWLVTDIHESDGQCTPAAGQEWNRTDTCLVNGHGRLATFTYRNGKFNALEREFRGFRQVRRIDADSNVTETTFGQDRPTRGRVLQVDTYLSNLARVRLETNEWHTAPLGYHTQIWQHKTAFVQADGQEGQVFPLARGTENAAPDAYGNITHSFTSGAFGIDRVDTYTEYATPQGGSQVFDKPRRVYSQRPSDAVPISEQWFYYDNLSYGSVGRGNVKRVSSIGDAATGGDADVLTAHDPYGNVTVVTDALGHTVTTTYDATALYAATVQNHLNQQTSTVTDYKLGKPASVTDVTGYQTSYEYDAAGRLTCIKPPLPAGGTPVCTVKYAYHYGSLNVLSSVDTDRIEPNNPGDGGYLRSTSYFDALLRPRETRSKRMVDTGNGTATMQTIVSGKTEYDRGGRVRKRYEPFLSTAGPAANAATSYEYALNGNGSNQLDPLGRVYQITSPQGTTRRMTYNGASHSTFNETNVETRVSVDPFERVLTEAVHTTSPTTPYSTRTFVYDGAGRVVSEKQNGIVATEITHSYDRLGRKTQMVDPDSGAWKYHYDKGGNLIVQDDPRANQRLEFCYDALNRITLACPLAADFNNNRINCAATTPCSSSQAILYRYDSASVGDPAVPNATGRLVKVTDGSGTTAFKGWDNRGRLLKVQKSIDVDSYAPKATTDFSYDSADRLSGILYPDGEWVLTQYDASGQPLTVSGNNGSFPYVGNVIYDLFGRAKVIEHSNGVDDVRSYYDSPGQTRHRHLATLQTVLGSTEHLDLTYTGYNARGQLTGINDVRDQIPSVLSNSAAYAYDDLGRLTTVSDNAQINGNYLQNEFGNITRKENRYYTYPAAKPHQMSEMRIGPSGTPTPVSHDANGSRIDPYTTPTPNQSNHQRYEYDEWNRLKTIKVINGSGTVLHTIVYTYDYTGRRVSKKVNSSVTRYYSELTETTSSYQYKTYFLGGKRVASQRTNYLGWEVASVDHGLIRVAAVHPGQVAVVLLVRRDVQAGLAVSATLLAITLTLAPWKRKRVVGIAVRHGQVMGVILAFTVATLPIPLIVAPAHAGCDDPPPTPTPPPAGDVQHYHTDHLGSTQVVTTQGSGGILEQIRYKPYGEVRYRKYIGGTDITDPDYRYEFTGYESEVKSGLAYAGARFYDPAAGMFLSHDPVRQFASPYTYTNWDPVNLTDPTGAYVDPTPFIVAGIVAAVLIHAAATAASIDAYVKSGNVLTSIKAGAVSLASSHVLPGTSFGLQLAAPGSFGQFNPAEYTIGLIPVVGSAYGAAQSFQNGNYASGVVGVAATVASAYGAYKAATLYYAKWYGTGVAQGATGTATTTGDAATSSGGCGCGAGDTPLDSYSLPETVIVGDRIEAVSILNDPLLNLLLVGLGIRAVLPAATLGTGLTRQSVIEGFSLSNHAFRKGVLGRGATEDMISGTIRGARAAGTVTTEVAEGKFAGNTIEIFVHDGVKVVTDSTRGVIMSIQNLSGFRF